MKINVKKILSIIVVIALVGAIGYLVYNYIIKKPTPAPPGGAVSADIDEETQNHEKDPELILHEKNFTVGEFGPDEERLNYENGSMTLIIPKMDYEGPVLSVDLKKAYEEEKAAGLNEEDIANKLVPKMDEILNEGIVLFNMAQLPGADNRNVSIAGHRDTKGMEFYLIDKLTDGDFIYLDYQGKRYVYEYTSTVITDSYDWAPIAVQDKSVITLQSCDPIYAPNGDYDRIFVVGTLVDIIDESPTNAKEDFDATVFDESLFLED